MEQWPTQVTCNQPEGTSNLPCEAMAHSNKLHLQCPNFTRSCLCCTTILPDITLAVPQLYQILLLLPHHFTGHCTCSRSILLDLAFPAPPFYQILHLQCPNFTRSCLCCPTILLDIALAADQFY